MKCSVTDCVGETDLRIVCTPTRDESLHNEMNGFLDHNAAL